MFAGFAGLPSSMPYLPVPMYQLVRTPTILPPGSNQTTRVNPRPGWHQPIAPLATQELPKGY